MTVSAAILFPAVCTSDTNNAEICHNIIINNPSNRKFIERFWRLKLVRLRDKVLYNSKINVQCPNTVSMIQHSLEINSGHLNSHLLTGLG